MLGQAAAVGAATLVLLSGAAAPALAYPAQPPDRADVTISDVAQIKNGGVATTVSYNLSPRHERGRDPGETRWFLRVDLIQDARGDLVRGREFVEDLAADGKWHRFRLTVDADRGQFRPGIATGTVDLMPGGGRPVVTSATHTIRII